MYVALNLLSKILSVQGFPIRKDNSVNMSTRRMVKDNVLDLWFLFPLFLHPTHSLSLSLFIIGAGFCKYIDKVCRLPTFSAEY